MSENRNPIYAGRCVFNVETLASASKVQKHRIPYAGVRVMQDEHYTPPSDVYLYVTAKDAQDIAAYFSKLARLIQEVEA